MRHKAQLMLVFDGQCCSAHEVLEMGVTATQRSLRASWDGVRASFDAIEYHVNAMMKSEALQGVGGGLETPSILMNSGMAALTQAVPKSRMPRLTGDLVVLNSTQS